MSSAAHASGFGVRSVLHVEDNPDHRKATKDLLETKGPFAVDFAADLKQADQHVNTAKYDLILVDVAFDTGDNERQGDEWVKDRFDKFHGAEVVIVTAQRGRIRVREWLREHNVSVVDKGRDEVKLYNDLARKATRLEPRAATPENEIDATTHLKRSSDMLTEKTLSLFYDWVDSLPDAERKDIWLGGQELSPRDIKNEMMTGSSAIGQLFASMFIDHVRIALGLVAEED